MYKSILFAGAMAFALMGSASALDLQQTLSTVTNTVQSVTNPATNAASSATSAVHGVASSAVQAASAPSIPSVGPQVASVPSSTHMGTSSYDHGQSSPPSGKEWHKIWDINLHKWVWYLKKKHHHDDKYNHHPKNPHPCRGDKCQQDPGDTTQHNEEEIEPTLALAAERDVGCDGNWIDRREDEPYQACPRHPYP